MPVSGARVVSYVSAFGCASFSVSNDGSILVGTGSDHYQLTWFNCEGKPLNTVGQPDRYAPLRISRDGKRVCHGASRLHGEPGHLVAGACARDSQPSDLWRILRNENLVSRRPSLNGRRLFARSANGPEQEEPPLESQYTVYLNDGSTDGPYLVYSQVSPEGRCERWLLPTTEDRKPAPFLQTSFDEMRGQVSPNSESIAYTSNESGRNEIYVQSFPGGGAGWLVSGGGGSLAR